MSLSTFPSTRSNELETVERAIELAASLVCHGFLENFCGGSHDRRAASPEDAAIPPMPQHGARSPERGLLQRLAVLDVQPYRSWRPGRDPLITLPGGAEWIVVDVSIARIRSGATFCRPAPPPAIRCCLSSMILGLRRHGFIFLSGRRYAAYSRSDIRGPVSAPPSPIVPGRGPDTLI